MVKELVALPQSTPSLIRRYVDLQKQLLAEFIATVPIDWYKGHPWFRVRMGAVSVESGTWDFQAHGAGVRFTHRETGVIVDPGEWIDHPHVFHDWRICQYAVSLGLRELEFEGTSYPLVDEDGDEDPRGVDRLLGVLLERGIIKEVPVDERHFAYALAEDAEPHAPVGAPEEGKEN